MGHVAVPIFLEQLKGDDHGLMQQTIEALGAIGPEARAAVPDLIQWLKLALWPKDVSWALARIGPEAALPLAEALDDPDERFRSWVAFTLGQIGPGASAAIPALTERLEDPSETVQLNAADALGKIRGEVAEISKELMTKESPPR